MLQAQVMTRPLLVVLQSVDMNIEIVYIDGDGIGMSVNKIPGVTELARRVLDEAVETVYSGQHKLKWIPALAGEAAFKKTGGWLPEETVEAIRNVHVALKGPLTTPVGKGFRSINVMLRKIFDLYACVRPIKYIEGVPAPNRNAEKVDMVVFRENTEDVYAGIEFEANSETANNLIRDLGRVDLRADWSYGIGLKPISEQGSKRLVRKAIRFALENGYSSVTLMHKGNIMKFTEGAFMKWGYDVAREEFSELVEIEADAHNQNKTIIKDRLADSMFQQIQLRPEDYGVIATTNLNGDYISDALAAMVGGLGFAPGSNLGEDTAIFEAVHGTAPKYTGQDLANPGSLILSGAMLLDHVGLKEAASAVRDALEATVKESAEAAGEGQGNKLYVTYDIARQFPGYSADDGAKASEFTNRIISNLRAVL